MPTKLTFAEDPRCQDLTEFTCVPGDHDDGTAVVRTPEMFPVNPDFQNRISQVKSSLTKKFAAFFERGVEYDFAAELTRTSQMPECARRPGQRPSDSCRIRTAEALSDLIIGWFSFSAATRDKSFQFSELILLLQRPGYYQIIQQQEEENLRIFPPTEFEQRMPELFAQAKKLAFENIDSWPIPEEKRIILRERIERTTFGRDGCGGQNLPALFTENATYMPLTDEIEFCRGFSSGRNSNESEFKFIHNIAHELAHSIDPCVITEFGPPKHRLEFQEAINLQELATQFYAPSVLQCLMSSLDVSTGSSFPNEDYFEESGGEIEDFDHPRQNPVWSFCGHPKLNELFCDWFATEVLNKYLKSREPQLNAEQIKTGLSNVWRTSCHPILGLSLGSDIHPPTHLRLNNILLSHPNIRQQMGCSSQAPFPYCGIKEGRSSENSTIYYRRPVQNTNGSGVTQ